MRVLAGLAIGALLLSAFSIWNTHRGLRALEEQQAQLLGKLQALGEGQPVARVAETIPPPEVAQRATQRALGPSTTWAAMEETESLPDVGEAARLELPQAGFGSDLATHFDGLPEATRLKAVEDLASMARWGDEGAREALLIALEDPDPVVRLKAVGAVAELGDAEAIASLSFLVDDPDRDVRIALADELGSTRNRAAGPSLRGLLRDESPYVVEKALQSLAEVRYEPARHQIERFATGDDIALAGAAGRALRALGDDGGADKAAESVARFVDDDDPETREQVLKALYFIGGDAALEQISVALQDPDPRIRGKAEWYVSELSD